MTAKRKRAERAAAARIVLVYATVASLWILVSDSVVAWLFPDVEAIRRLSMAKGILFVVVTGTLLYTLIVRHLGQVIEKEKALETSDLRFREALEAARHMMYRLDVKAGRYDYVSPSVEAVTGYPVEEFATFGLAGALEHLHPDDRSKVEAHIAEASRQGGRGAKNSLTLEYRFRGKDGRYIWFEDWTTLSVDESGDVEAFIGTAYDITERKEREALLRQAQKMESIGRLAGGIAHDFNNLLTVILGDCSLALRKTPKESPIHGRLEDIRDASLRAATLTQQLLAFSRKQILQPKVFDPNEAVRGVESILRRFLGEEIELEMLLAPDAWNVKADPAQLEQVVINLAVNARDAMGGGGRLSIATRNVGHGEAIPPPEGDAPLPPGDYVSLSVSDNGSGMSEEVRRKAFEPFFTTKEVGKGTGLGLSMVFGVVAQSHGRVTIESREGSGTTVSVFLPRTDTPPTPAEAEAGPPPGRGSGAVLVVEDEGPVRALMVRTLREHGYRVAEAPGGAEALGMLEREEVPCDLLLVDVMMPRMGGVELGGRVGALRPGTKVLFVSGYSGSELPGMAVLPQGAAFIQKPFDPDSLVKKVQELI